MSMKLKIIPKEEEMAYAIFSGRVAYCILSNSSNSIQELHKTNSDVEGNTEEIGLAVGQIVYDKVIELTKDMPREQLVKYLAEAIFDSASGMMTLNPNYLHALLLIGPNL